MQEIVQMTNQFQRVCQSNDRLLNDQNQIGKNKKQKQIHKSYYA